jgi:hypothetical protein
VKPAGWRDAAIELPTLAIFLECLQKFDVVDVRPKIAAYTQDDGHLAMARAVQADVDEAVAWHAAEAAAEAVAIEAGGSGGGKDDAAATTTTALSSSWGTTHTTAVSDASVAAI